MELKDAFNARKVARIVEGATARALVGHISMAEIVCGGYEKGWYVMI